MRTQKCIIIIILVEILIIELDKLLLFGGRESSHECRYKLHCRMPDSHSSLQQNIPTQNWKFALAYGLLLIKWDINSSQRHTHRCYCVTADLKLKYIQIRCELTMNRGPPSPEGLSRWTVVPPLSSRDRCEVVRRNTTDPDLLCSRSHILTFVYRTRFIKFHHVL